MPEIYNLTDEHKKIISSKDKLGITYYLYNPAKGYNRLGLAVYLIENKYCKNDTQAKELLTGEEAKMKLSRQLGTLNNESNEYISPVITKIQIPTDAEFWNSYPEIKTRYDEQKLETTTNTKASKYASLSMSISMEEKNMLIAAALAESSPYLLATENEIAGITSVILNRTLEKHLGDTTVKAVIMHPGQVNGIKDKQYRYAMSKLDSGFALPDEDNKKLTPYDKFSLDKKIIQLRDVVEKVLSGAIADPTVSLGDGKGAIFWGNHGDFHGKTKIFIEAREKKEGKYYMKGRTMGGPISLGDNKTVKKIFFSLFAFFICQHLCSFNVNEHMRKLRNKVVCKSIYDYFVISEYQRKYSGIYEMYGPDGVYDLKDSFKLIGQPKNKIVHKDIKLIEDYTYYGIKIMIHRIPRGTADYYYLAIADTTGVAYGNSLVKSDTTGMAIGYRFLLFDNNELFLDTYNFYSIHPQYEDMYRYLKLDDYKYGILIVTNSSNSVNWSNDYLTFLFIENGKFKEIFMERLNPLGDNE